MRCGKMLKDEVAEYCEDCAKRKSYITQEGASGCIRNRYRMHYTDLSIIINDVMDQSFRKNWRKNMKRN
mgnify:CR=1 FL=1